METQVRTPQMVFMQPQPDDVCAELRAVCRSAREGPVSEVPPRPATEAPQPRAPVEALDRVGGLLAMMRAFEGTQDEGEITLALLGLRRGEILGLRIRRGEEDPDNGDLVLDGPNRACACDRS